MSEILIVDDALLTREALAKLLQHEGYGATTAANGRDAWAMLYELTLRGQSLSLIILDLMMPQMDGVMFLKLLRRSDHWSSIPVLVLTGLDDEAHLVQRARKLGVDEIISKSGSGTEQLLLGVKRILSIMQRPAAAAPNIARRRAPEPVALRATAAKPAAARIAIPA